MSNKNNKEYDNNFNLKTDYILNNSKEHIAKIKEEIELETVTGTRLSNGMAVFTLKENDGRHNVSDSALDDLKETMYEQDHYGMDKYKEPLHHSYDYDWMKMFEQEIADGLKYLKNEKERKKVVIALLEDAKQSESLAVKDLLIREALKELLKGGREKKG